jgi:hypothetical protein
VVGTEVDAVYLDTGMTGGLRTEIYVVKQR